MVNIDRITAVSPTGIRLSFAASFMYFFVIPAKAGIQLIIEKYRYTIEVDAKDWIPVLPPERQTGTTIESPQCVSGSSRIPIIFAEKRGWHTKQISNRVKVGQFGNEQPCPNSALDQRPPTRRPGAGRSLSSWRLKRNRAAGRPPVAVEVAPVASTRSAFSTRRRKFCL